MKLKRLKALAMAALMVVSITTSSIPAYAEPASTNEGPCSHHATHDDTCGYKNAVEGVDCTHKHDSSCGYAEAQAEVLCNKNCTDTDSDGEINHAEGCAYQPAVTASPCNHSHDNTCGYVAATPGSPCTFVCNLCECTCTSLCDTSTGNQDCPVCATNPDDCAFSEVSVSCSFDSDYAEYGKGKTTTLTLQAEATGKRLTDATVTIQLTDEEAALLRTIELGINVSWNSTQNTLSFMLSKDTPFNKSLSLSFNAAGTLDISPDDITITVTPAEGVEAAAIKQSATGDSITIVEKLPTDDAYGSATAYGAQVADLPVYYVDSEGNPAPRQEQAPTFTLYYQVDGTDPVAVKEGFLPFDLTTMPKITATAAETQWTGSVEASSMAMLPSKVLAMVDGKYVEKEVRWYLQPSYPEGYYPDAGTLQEVTDGSLDLEPGWYFIGAQNPLPDDEVTVEEYLDLLSYNVYWADNGNADNNRPDFTDSSNLVGYYELQYAINGSSSYQPLDESSLQKLGLTQIPQPKWTQGSGIWTLSWEDSLPSRILYQDSTGTDDTVPQDIDWKVVFTQAPENYTMVEITPENAGHYSSIHGEAYGTYYVLETSLTFTARIYQGDAGHTADDLREAFLEQFYLDAAYTGEQHQYFQLTSVRDDGHFKDDAGDAELPPELIQVTITNLWRYNLDNTRINYSIREGKPTEDSEEDEEEPVDPADGKLDGIDSLEDGDYFAISYNNSSVPSFSHITDAVYSGGLLKLTLTGTITYTAEKVWLDDNATSRPDAEFELWRYRRGEAYTTASLVRKANGMPYTLELTECESADNCHYTITFPGEDEDPLPKYDPEGHRYLYVVREYLSGTNAGSYEQVFGSVAEDGTVTDTLPETVQRVTGDTFLYNGGTLSNRLRGTVPVSVTKDWKAASFQSEFEDVMVEMRLQSRYKSADGTDTAWENTEYTCQIFDFKAETLSITHTGSYPQYDSQGRELEYQWVEESVYQGGKVEDGVYTGGTKVESDVAADGTRTFTLQQSGREILYTSTVTVEKDPVDDEEINHTIVTNSIANTIWYDVTKEFQNTEGAAYKDEYSFTLFRTTSGSGLTPYATFNINKNGDPEPEIKKVNESADSASLSIASTGGWKVHISGLPEFDADGQQYEYLLLENDGSPLQMTTERDTNGNYSSVVYNGTGSDNIILVRKVWIDESDVQHRQPVIIQVYNAEDNTPIKDATVTLGDSGDWYALVSIGNRNPADVYILETKVGTTDVPISTLPSTSSGTKPNLPGSTQFQTEHHKYEATYSFEELKPTESTNKTIPCFTVTNRRLGNIRLTITKDWKDGDGEKRKTLKEELEDAGLELAVRLDFASMSQDSSYEITRTGYMDDSAGDTVTISEGNPTPIQNNTDDPVASIQQLDLDSDTQTLYFWNLPKYDKNGASVRYTVEEVFVEKSSGDIVSESDIKSEDEYKDVAAAWADYQCSIDPGPYNVGANHALDTQNFTITNKLSATTTVNWYTLWQDDYAYETGNRPDIYLDIYATIHVKDDNGEVTTQTSIYRRNYRWEYNEELDRQNFWICTLEGLPQYDDLGYEIVYSAVMNSSVKTTDFDYQDTAYAAGQDSDGSEGIFATATGVLNDGSTGEDKLTHLGEDEGGKYALNAGNTFVNTIYDTITYAGEKLWTNLPDNYPAVDLPTVTFTLSRQTKDDTNAEPVATMTIDGEDWNSLKTNGRYIFEFGCEGSNTPSPTFVSPSPPTSCTLLPRFDEKGRLYIYSLDEEIDWTNTNAGTDGQGDSIFNTASTGQTFTNSYNKTGTAQLDAIKYLTVEKNQNVYPAVTMVLSRTYTTSKNVPSSPETVQTLVWSAKDVADAVEGATSTTGEMVTVAHTFTFDNLPVYAPNGSTYVYTITEDKSHLGGFDTWAANGNVTAEGLEVDTNKGQTSVGNLTAAADETIDASFLNKPVTSPDSIQLTGKKVWEDWNNVFGLRPDSITIKLERMAPPQPGQDNDISWQEVPITGTTLTWEKPENSNIWTYKVTGLDRYAPNGMPWQYRVTEKDVPTYYTGNPETATQTSVNNENGYITMGDLKNSIFTSTWFKKTWVDQNGKSITDNLLGNDLELEVTYELQVRAKLDPADWSDWQSAKTYFQDITLMGETDLAGRDYTGSIRAPLGDEEWKSPYYGTEDSFKELPLYIKTTDDQIYRLEYRVVETSASVYATDETKPLYTQAYKAPTDNGGDTYAYQVTPEGNSTSEALFAPYYEQSDGKQPNSTKEHKNQLQTTSITVKKHWMYDSGLASETRPESNTSYDWEVTFLIERTTDGQDWEPIPGNNPYVTLYGNNTADSVEKSITGLPLWTITTAGTMVKCQYRIREMPSTGSTTAGTEPLKDGDRFHGSYIVSYQGDFTAVNTLQKVDLPVRKVWQDNNNNAGLRPVSITVELYRNGIATGKILTLGPNLAQRVWNFLTGSDDGWSGVFTDLPQYDISGKPYIYTVKEISTPAGYAVSYGPDADNPGTYVITNTAQGGLSVSKTVTGSGDTTKEFQFTVTLADNTITGTYGEMTFANGVAQFTLTDGETKTASGLPGNLGYTVTEQEANQGAYATTTTGAEGVIPPGDTAQATFTNALDRISIPVVKRWDDENDRDDLRPESITVRLLADGNDTGKTLILDATNHWKGVFENLDVTTNGTPIHYTVEEVQVRGYETSITGTPAEGFVITNTHTPDQGPMPSPSPSPTPTQDSTADPVTASSTIPMTGDSMNISLLWCLAGASALGLLLCGGLRILSKRKKRNNKQSK